MELAGKRVAVLGLARSGIAAARYLARRGAVVVAMDRKGEEGLAPEALGLRSMGVELRTNVGWFTDLGAPELVVVSPGVPWMLPELVEARRQTEVIAEIELGYRELRGVVVAITGTKGKSTTTAALGAILSRSRPDVRVGGNIGTPLIGLVEGATPQTVFVVETSSFQLQGTRTFHPKVAVYLDLFTDHLDQHADFDEYAAAKARIFANQDPGDFAVVNADDPLVLKAARRGAARIVTFSTKDAPPEPGDAAYLDGSMVRLRVGPSDEALFDREAVRLRGAHLLVDLVAASTAARLLGAAPEDIAATVAEFRGAEHVLEEVARIEGVTFVNDSKATNVEAARLSLGSFDGPLVLILGGRYKGGDFAALAPELRASDRRVVAIGEARPRIVAALGPTTEVLEAASMDEAVRRGFDILRRRGGGTVLLAPACSSFDMFTGYAQRGDAFKAAVTRLQAAAGDEAIRG